MGEGDEEVGQPVMRSRRVVVDDRCEEASPALASQARASSRFEPLAIVSDTGVPMVARLVLGGEGYGRWDAVAGTWALALAPDAVPEIEFFDARYQHTPFGQFTGARYRLSTILSNWPPAGCGLALQSGEPDWCLDGQEVAKVRAWAGRCIGELLAEKEGLGQTPGAESDRMRNERPRA